MTDTEKIVNVYKQAANGKWREPQIPSLWDGHAAERIVKIILDKL